MLRINVVTLFRDWSAAPLSSSIRGRAAKAGLVQYRVVQLRDYTHDKHQTVDDAPYGGGAGMVLKPEPFFEAVEDLNAKPPIVLLSARGRPFRHDTAGRVAGGGGGEVVWGGFQGGGPAGGGRPGGGGKVDRRVFVVGGGAAGACVCR